MVTPCIPSIIPIRIFIDATKLSNFRPCHRELRRYTALEFKVRPSWRYFMSITTGNNRSRVKEISHAGKKSRKSFDSAWFGGNNFFSVVTHARSERSRNFINAVLFTFVRFTYYTHDSKFRSTRYFYSIETNRSRFDLALSFETAIRTENERLLCN